MREGIYAQMKNNIIEYNCNKGITRKSIEEMFDELFNKSPFRKKLIVDIDNQKYLSLITDEEYDSLLILANSDDFNSVILASELITIFKKRKR